MRTERKYRDLFRVELVESKNRVKKKVIYTGDYYKTDMPRDQIVKYKICFILVSVLMAALFFCMGLLNNDGSRTFYVVFPYILQLLPIAYTIISAVSFYPKEVLTVVQYEKAFIRIRTAGTWILILSVAGAIGETVYILGGYGNTVNLELIFLICNLVMAALAIVILSIHSRIKFKTVPNNG